uniref:Uncharacterized protein n=1 Tax=Compsopogon caeruleus TaxID=31354 RepID=A0A7S1TD02_9RHOD|eukprot:CAMPEP_0184687930 /NCGR_PEP_ID=MMETSP0312-20130426/28017_1 /TAXON_ID=31354 /ORGANISM="Compsopogon coeruleus, Strain SAG 36.94" /LENGTH=752 /DNA_ID=CAMNT_0027144559 /DNA_START=81 /DNA_END=2339 /DNA_ORIENTATION=+
MTCFVVDRTVCDAAKEFRDLRVDAAVVFEEECRGVGRSKVCGIVTVNDIARSVARAVPAERTTLREVMTPGPLLLEAEASPAEALRMMREGRFRHIPVFRGDALAGIVDVLSLACYAITLVREAYEGQKKSVVPSGKRAWVFWRGVQATMESPTRKIETALGSSFASVATGASVRSACQAMAQSRSSACCVVANDGTLELLGILTSRDVTVHLVAVNRDPDQTLVDEIMTRSPKTIEPSGSTLDALERMQKGNFRHVPVVHQSRVVGMVDVLSLACLALADADSAETTLQHPTTNSVASPRSFWTMLFSSAASAPKNETPLEHVDTENLPDSQSTPGQNPAKAIPGVSKSFKFKDVNGDWHRIQSDASGSKGCLDALLAQIRRRCGLSFKSQIKVKYLDEDNDEVMLACDDDLAECGRVMDRLAKTAIILKVETRGGEDASDSISEVSRVNSPTPSDHGTIDLSPEKPVKEGREIELLLQAGHRLLQEGDIAGAVDHYSNLLRRDANNTLAYTGRAAAFLLLERPREAERDYRKAIELLEMNPSPELSDSARTGLAETLIELQRYEEALDVIETIENASSQASALVAVNEEQEICASSARVAISSGDHPGALGYLVRAIRLNGGGSQRKFTVPIKEDASLYALRGNCYVELEDAELALEDFSRSIQISERQSEAWVGQGRVHRMLGKGLPAWRCYRRALMYAPREQSESISQTMDELVELFGIQDEIDVRSFKQRNTKISSLGSQLKDLKIR